jgi:hypothetical protein
MRRRDFLGGALAGALAAPALADADAPAPNLASVLQVVQLAAFASARILSDGLLGPTATAVTRRIHDHETVHVQLLRPAVRKLGLPPPPEPTSVAGADQQLSGVNASLRLARVRDEAGALGLLYDVESIAIGQCYETLRTLADTPLIRLTASIMGAEAQHASAIGGLLHPGKWTRVVPVGSVQGKR